MTVTIWPATASGWRPSYWSPPFWWQTRSMYDDLHRIRRSRTGGSMMSPRERMVASTALLIRERGAHATAIADVLAHSGAPRGSAYHYFPGGRTQLLCEAIDYAGEYVAGRITAAGSGLDALDGLVATYR